MRGWFAAAAVLLVALALWGAHHAGYTAGKVAGRTAAELAQAKVAAAAQAQAEAAQARADAAGHAMQVAIDLDVPAIEVHTYADTQAIATLYLDRPAGADACSRPDGVQARLDQAVARANAAARGELPGRAAAAPVAASSSAAKR